MVFVLINQLFWHHMAPLVENMPKQHQSQYLSRSIGSAPNEQFTILENGFWFVVSIGMIIPNI